MAARSLITIIGVVAVAALAGWLVMDLVDRSRVEPAKQLEAARADPTRVDTLEGVKTAETESANTGGDDAGDDEIESQLTKLASALRLDETIENRVFPPILTGAELAMRTTFDFRRPVRFWQPAFAAAAKKQP